MKKLNQIYHFKQMDLLNPVCTSPGLERIGVHCCFAVHFEYILGNGWWLNWKSGRRHGCWTFHFSKSEVVASDKKHRSSLNACKSTVETDASNLYPYALRQAIPTGLNTRWEFFIAMQPFKPSSNKAWFFEKIVAAFLQSSCPERKIPSLYTTGNPRKKI